MVGFFVVGVESWLYVIERVGVVGVEGKVEFVEIW